MIQDAVVLNAYPNGTAEVAVNRGTACGSNCGDCEVCKYQNEIKIIADNKIKAIRGQHVEVESKSSEIFKAEMLLYVLPLVFLIVGFLIPSFFGCSEMICVGVAFLALIIGVAIIMRIAKKRKDIEFRIVRFVNDD